MKAKAIIILLAALALAGPAYGAVQLRAQDAELCFKCHEDMAQKMQMPYLHTPIKEKNCSGCHDSHTAEFPRLIIKDDKELCLECHKDKFKESVLPENQHTPVAKGECLVCHDPHGSDYKGVLKDAPRNICNSCHEDLITETTIYQHPTFREGECSRCHDPHGSDLEYNLLDTSYNLCSECHSPTDNNIKIAHSPFNMRGKPCTPCHNPHASGRSKLINRVAHPAVTDRKCDACHATTSGNPDATVKQGSELCYSCHTEERESFKVGKQHPLVKQGDCLGCHTPHASAMEGLSKRRERDYCLDCHQNLKEREQAYRFKHSPVEKGKCTVCHAAHNSKEKDLLDKDAELVCRSCHGTTTPGMKFGHPSGPGVFDPRDPERKTIVTCVTCHDSHGTFYPFHLRESGRAELCLECHETNG